MLIGLLWSCGSLSTVSVTKFPSRTYDFCEKKWISDNVGKLCYRYCAKYKFLHPKKPNNCKEWKVITEDLSDPVTFQKFISGNHFAKPGHRWEIRLSLHILENYPVKFASQMLAWLVTIYWRSVHILNIKTWRKTSYRFALSTIVKSTILDWLILSISIVLRQKCGPVDSISMTII